MYLKIVILTLSGTELLRSIILPKEVETARVGEQSTLLSCDGQSYMLKFPSPKGCYMILSIFLIGIFDLWAKKSDIHILLFLFGPYPKLCIYDIYSTVICSGHSLCRFACFISKETKCFHFQMSHHFCSD